MNLKLGGFIHALGLLGILTGNSIAAVVEENETTSFITDSEDDHEDAHIIEEYVRDVYVVCPDGDPDYVEFVKETISAHLKAEGYIYVKVAGKEVQLIDSNEGLEGTNVAGGGDGAAGNMIEEIVNVLVLDDVRYNVIVLAKSNNMGEMRGLDSLFAHITTKKSRIHFLALEHDEQAVRSKRAASGGISVYQQIAQSSGGMVIQTTKNNIGSVVNLLKQTLKTNPVDIMRFEFIRPAGQYFKVPVDDTMTQLTLQIQTQTALPVAMITNPFGMPVSLKGALTPLGSKLEIIEFNMTKSSDYGQWKFTKLAPSDWGVTVRGQSPVDFTYAFMEPGPGGIGSYPIKGRPISGKTYQLSVKIPQIDKIQNVYAAMLLDNHNIPMGMASLKNIGGRSGKTMFTANVTIPKVDFKVAVDGMDKTSHEIRRLDPILVSPISIRLQVLSLSGTKLYVNETLNIPFTVTNEAGKQQDVLINIEDDKNFAQSPVFMFYTLKAGENVTKHFTIKGGLVAGVTTTLTITAKPYVRNQQTKGQFEIRRFTVGDRQKKVQINDTINPTCNVTSVTGTCKFGPDLCACVNHTWSMEVLVGDEGLGIQDIFPSRAGSNISFYHNNYSIGHTIDKGPIKASISADCCHQMASIQVMDKAGNLAQCMPNITQNFTTPDPKVCNHANVNQTIGCKTITHIGTCNFGLNPCDCHTQSWHLKTEFNRTNNIDLHQAFTIGAGNNASLTRTGQVVEVDLDCCHQEIIIVGQDLAGNIGECNVTLPNYQGLNPLQCKITSPAATTTATSTVKTSKLQTVATLGAHWNASFGQTPLTATFAKSPVSDKTTVASTSTTSKSNAMLPSISGTTSAPANIGTTFARSPVSNKTTVASTSTTSKLNAVFSSISGTTSAPVNIGTSSSANVSSATTKYPSATNTHGSKTLQKVAASSPNSSRDPESVMVADIVVEAVGDVSDVVVNAIFSKRTAGKAAKSGIP